MIQLNDKDKKFVVRITTCFALIAVFALIGGYIFFGDIFGLLKSREDVIFADVNLVGELNEQAASLGILPELSAGEDDHVLLTYITPEELSKGLDIREFNAKMLSAIYLPFASDERLGVYQISILGEALTDRPAVSVGGSNIRLHCLSRQDNIGRGRLSCVPPPSVSSAILQELPRLDASISSDVSGEWIVVNSLSDALSHQSLYFAWNFYSQTGVAFVQVSKN